MIEFDVTAEHPTPKTELFVIYDTTNGRILSFHGFVGEVTPSGTQDREHAALEGAATNPKRQNLGALRAPPDFEFEPGAIYKVETKTRQLEIAHVLEGGLASTQVLRL
jgi:hypothetical protein